MYWPGCGTWPYQGGQLLCGSNHSWGDHQMHSKHSTCLSQTHSCTHLKKKQKQWSLHLHTYVAVMGDLAVDRPTRLRWAYLGLWQSSGQLKMISPTLARWRWAYLGSAMLKPAKSLIGSWPRWRSLAYILYLLTLRHNIFNLSLYTTNKCQPVLVSLLVYTHNPPAFIVVVTELVINLPDVVTKIKICYFVAFIMQARICQYESINVKCLVTETSYLECYPRTCAH